MRTARSIRIFAVVFAREMRHVHRIQDAQCWRKECWSMTPSAPRAQRKFWGATNKARRRGGKRLGGHAASMLRHLPQPLTRCITLQSRTRGTCSQTHLGGLVIKQQNQKAAEDSEDSSQQIISQTKPLSDCLCPRTQPRMRRRGLPAWFLSRRSSCFSGSCLFSFSPSSPLWG
jgi:hypothetical protein